MKTKEIARREKEKTYKTTENALEAKHEKARKFIQSVDISKVEALLGKKV